MQQISKPVGEHEKPQKEPDRKVGETAVGMEVVVVNRDRKLRIVVSSAETHCRICYGQLTVSQGFDHLLSYVCTLYWGCLKVSLSSTMGKYIECTVAFVD